MDFLNRINNTLLGPAGKQVPPAVETIQKITDRLTQSSLLSDRRAAVLSLKSLTRDWKEAVGEHSLPALIAALEVDAKEDPDIGKAILETLVALCECEEPEEGAAKRKVSKDDIGLKHTDVVLQVGLITLITEFRDIGNELKVDTNSDGYRQPHPYIRYSTY